MDVPIIGLFGRNLNIVIEHEVDTIDRECRSCIDIEDGEIR